MKKLLLLSILVAFIGPPKAHALLTSDEILSYAAMPLAVSDVCDVRGVQTDEVGQLVSYMDQANVPPDQFINVFRYVPVALTLNAGRGPDFVNWVGDEVNQGIVGDQLVSVMEQRLVTYGNGRVVSLASFRQPAYRYRYYGHHHRRRYYGSAYAPYYETAYQPDYIPTDVVRYVDYEMLDPFALIDEPVAVANVVDLGVPIARIGNFVLQLNLAGVAPVQTVELLRYAPAALVPVTYGQPDLVQYVYDQRVNGVVGYDLVQAVDQQLPVYGITPRIDLSTPVYVGPNTYVPSYVNDYVAPVNPAWVPPPVRTQVAAYTANSGAYAQPYTAAPTAVAPSYAGASPQVQRLLQQQGNPVVTNPAQARREIAQSMRAQREAMRAQGAVAAPQIAAQRAFRGATAAPVTPAPSVAAPQALAHANGRPFGGQPPGLQRAHGRFAAAPQTAAAPQMAAAPRVERAHGRAAVMARPRPSVRARPQMMRQQMHPQMRPQMMRQRVRPQMRPQMMRPQRRQQVMRQQARPQFVQRPVRAARPAPPQMRQAPPMARPRMMPRPQVQRGGPPARVMARPAPAAAPAPQAPPQRGNGNGNGHGKGKH